MTSHRRLKMPQRGCDWSPRPVPSGPHLEDGSVAGVGIVDLGAPELLIILVIALLIFGSNKLPKLARSLGQASREFKAATSEGWVEEKVQAHTTPTPTPTPTPEVTPAPSSSAPDGA